MNYKKFLRTKLISFSQALSFNDTFLHAKKFQKKNKVKRKSFFTDFMPEGNKHALSLTFYEILFVYFS